jgi:hypothetical protein
VKARQEGLRLQGKTDEPRPVEPEVTAFAQAFDLVATKQSARLRVRPFD